MEATSQDQVWVRQRARSAVGGIRLAGFVRHGRGVPSNPMRRLGSYAAVYLVDGLGFYADENGLSQTVRAGDLIILFPTLAHAYGPRPGKHWTEFYLVFDGPTFELWEANGIFNPARPIHHVEPVDHWLQRLEAILGASRQPGFSPPLVELCRLQLTLAEMLSGERWQEAGEEPAWTARACALLESDLSRDLNWHQLAADLGMSYDRFRKRFTRAVGVAPARYRMSCIIDRACELMQQGKLTDRELAERLGFCDEFYFSRRFKQLTGYSPRAFREGFPRTG
jgi:AraC-like DNA-binding protein